MRLVTRGMMIAFAALSLAGTLPTPIETVLHRFAGGSDGADPEAGLIADEQGALFKLTPPAWTETVLYNFCSQPSCSDGGAPFAGLIADEHGALYGTTANGGSSSNGTAFKLTPPAKGQTAWTETVLYSFCSQPGCSDGTGLQAGLITDKSGALYGTTSGGGTGFNGTVFKLTPPATGQTQWTESVLHSFGFTGSGDGGAPVAGLIADEQGALYGTTSGGGTGSNGTVFKLTPPAWTESALYNFCSHPSCSDGVGPLAGLIADNSGALYGTTHAGGSSGNGTVFKLTPPATGQTAWTETVLYSFLGGSDGGAPRAGLIADEQGALYGTTTGGGIGSNGTVFKLTPPAKGQTAWTETVL